MRANIATGIASFGMSGRIFHEPLLRCHPGFTLKKVLSRSGKQPEKLSPGISVCKTYEELINDPGIELIVVNVPDHLHYDFARRAILAGKHTVVEKPFTVSVDEGKELIRLAKEKKRVLSVFQNRRWDSDFLAIRKALSDKVLGRIVEFEAHFDRYRPEPASGTWKEQEGTGTGVLYNLGAHLIDQALVLFGWPEAVYADMDQIRRNGKVNDYFTIHLYYPETRVILKSSYLVCSPGPKYIIHGETGSLYKFGNDPQEEQLSRGMLPRNDGYGIEPSDPRSVFQKCRRIQSRETSEIPLQKGNYLQYYDQVFHAIRNQSNDYISGEEGLDVIRIITTATESAQKGIRVIPAR